MSTRINRYLAHATGLSRRGADEAVAQGKVQINGKTAQLGDSVEDKDSVTLDGAPVSPNTKDITIVLHKPVGYVCSRDGQGSRTVYDLLPAELHALQSVGRLDKDSSGLLVMTTDGQLAHQLTHPAFQKKKVYEITLHKPLHSTDADAIRNGVELEDGISLMRIAGEGTAWQITMFEGRNRQIRRTFEQLGYTVKTLHRTNFGPYRLGELPKGKFKNIE